jgi:hypothetical protein
MNLENKIRQQLNSGELKRPGASLQKVSKQRIREVLQSLSLGSEDQVDAVFALLDDQTPSWFSRAADKNLKIADGASTAHVACHVGILQRDSGKLDREGRDYWLKPLWSIGALEKVTFDPAARKFIDGHPTAKSPNSAYRIAASFLDILRANATNRLNCVKRGVARTQSAPAYKFRRSSQKPPRLELIPGTKG